MVLGKLDSDMQEKNTGPLLTPYTKINSRWMKDLNIRQEVIKILEQKADNNLFDLSFSNFSLDMSEKGKGREARETCLEARETKAKK